MPVENIQAGANVTVTRAGKNVTIAADSGPGGGPHASTHQPGGSDPMAVDAAANVGSLRTLGTGAQQAAAGNHTHPPAGGSRLPQAISLGGYVLLTNVGATYDAIALAKGLGLAVVDFTGVTSIDFRVLVNKVGTGTQSWQLWNVTDGTQIGVIDDAAGAGERVLAATIAAGIPTGKKVVRVRAKSTVACDDPVFYGATIALQ